MRHSHTFQASMIARPGRVADPRGRFDDDEPEILIAFALWPIFRLLRRQAEPASKLRGSRAPGAPLLAKNCHPLGRAETWQYERSAAVQSSDSSRK